MISKVTFVISIVFMAFVVGALACFGWMQGYAWWRRKEYYSKS